MGLISLLLRLLGIAAQENSLPPVRTLLRGQPVLCRGCGKPLTDAMAACGSCGESRIGPPPDFEEKHG